MIGAGVPDQLGLFVCPIVLHSRRRVKGSKAVFWRLDRHLPHLHGFERLFVAGDPFYSGALTLLEPDGNEFRPALWGKLTLRTDACDFDGKTGLLAVGRVKRQSVRSTFTPQQVTRSQPEKPPDHNPRKQKGALRCAFSIDEQRNRDSSH
jgi:hypothetical protein